MPKADAHNCVRRLGDLHGRLVLVVVGGQLTGHLHQPAVGVRLQHLLRPHHPVPRTVHHDQVDQRVPCLPRDRPRHRVEGDDVHHGVQLLGVVLHHLLAHLLVLSQLFPLLVGHFAMVALLARVFFCEVIARDRVEQALDGIGGGVDHLVLVRVQHVQEEGNAGLAEDGLGSVDVLLGQFAKDTDA